MPRENLLTRKLACREPNKDLGAPFSKNDVTNEKLSRCSVPLQLEVEVVSGYREIHATNRTIRPHEVFMAFAALEAVGQRDPREL